MGENMAKDLGSLSDEELEQLNISLSNERAEIKDRQRAIAAELDVRAEAAANRPAEAQVASPAGIESEAEVGSP